MCPSYKNFAGSNVHLARYLREFAPLSQTEEISLVAHAAGIMQCDTSPYFYISELSGNTKVEEKDSNIEDLETYFGVPRDAGKN